MTRRSGGCWPGAEHERLLRAAVVDGPDVAEAWRALRPRLCPDALDRASVQFLPLLADNLSRHGIDDPLLAPAAVVRRASALQNRLLFDGGRGLVQALAVAGIPSLVLKGGALAAARYRDVSLRPMRDLDVLVPTARAAAAIGVLRSAGWTPRSAITPAVIRTQHAAELAGPGLSRCDLHWHVYWECCQADDDEALWAASVPLDFEGMRTRMLGPADQLLHVLIHGTRRTERPVLLWIADAMLVLRAGGIDWTRLVEQAASRRFVLRTAATLEYLRSAFAAPVPADVLAELRGLPVAALERLEYAVINRPQGLLGELPSYWCNYLRIRERGRRPSLVGFARYLQHIWQLESVGAMTLGALARAGTRLRGAMLGPPVRRR